MYFWQSFGSMLTHSCDGIVIHCGDAHQFFHPAQPLNGILARPMVPVPPQTRYMIICDRLGVDGAVWPGSTSVSLPRAHSITAPPTSHPYGGSLTRKSAGCKGLRTLDLRRLPTLHQEGTWLSLHIWQLPHPIVTNPARRCGHVSCCPFLQFMPI